MSKYDALSAHLKEANATELNLSFDAVERVLGFALPASARKFSAWWANDASAGRHANAWLSAGYRAENLNLTGQTVTFVRSSIQPARHATTAPQSAPARNVDPPPARNIGDPIKISVEIQWKEIGTITLENDDLQFPGTPSAAALYRFRLISESGARSYIGETINVQRRFAHYRKPGPTQATNIRINAVFREHLKDGDAIFVDLITSDVTIRNGDAEIPVDLTDKATRRLIENAALIADNSTEVENLNL